MFVSDQPDKQIRRGVSLPKKKPRRVPKKEFNRMLHLPLILAPQDAEDAGKLTVVLDLDETLIHTRLVSQASSDTKDCFYLPSYHQNFLLVEKRPHLDDFLRNLVTHACEVIVWTAGA